MTVILLLFLLSLLLLLLLLLFLLLLDLSALFLKRFLHTMHTTFPPTFFFLLFLSSFLMLLLPHPFFLLPFFPPSPFLIHSTSLCNTRALWNRRTNPGYSF